MRRLVEKTSKGRHALIFQESVKSSKLYSQFLSPLRIHSSNASLFLTHQTRN